MWENKQRWCVFQNSITKIKTNLICILHFERLLNEKGIGIARGYSTRYFDFLNYFICEIKPRDTQLGIWVHD